MFLDVCLVSLYTGLMCLDRRTIGQALVSQPLVTVSILGLWFDLLPLALLMGSVLQLLWMSSNLYGANIPQNETLVAATSAGSVFIALKTGMIANPNSWILAVIAAAPMAVVGKRVQEWLDRENTKYSDQAIADLESNKTPQLVLLVARSILTVCVVHSLMAFCVLYMLIGVLVAFAQVGSADLLDAMVIIGGFVLPAVALSVSLSLVRRRLYLAVCLLSFITVIAVIHSGRGLL